MIPNAGRPDAIIHSQLMRFVFSRLFFILLAIGLLPLSVSWQIPFLRTIVIVFDAGLIATAILDYFISRRLLENVSARRQFDRRFAIGDPSEVGLEILNESDHDLRLKLKDEYPSAMMLRDKREAEMYLDAHEIGRFSYF